MTKSLILRTAVVSLLLLGFAGLAQAQDDSTLTAEQLAAKFEAQRTRGLVIAPSDTTTTSGTDTTATTASGDATYVAVDADAQVNIQIKFDFDSAALGDSEMPKLATLCQVIKSSDIPQFKIIGHTDAAGTDSYNQNLSLLRAEEVKRHLVSDCGIADTRLIAVGVGEKFPLDAADPKADVNRRVEFQVVS